MRDYLKRLLTSGAAYQAADIVAKGLAVILLPLYTAHVPTKGYGAYQSLLTAVILSSIFLRVGLGEAFVRFYFTDHDQQRRARIARTVTATVAWTTTVAALVALAFSAELCQLILGFRDPDLMDCAILGMWAFTNLEMAYAQLRVDERARAYLYASMANVAMTVTFTVLLVVFADQQARGLLLGNFGASAIVVLGLWVVLARARRFSLRFRFHDLRAMLRFGVPTVPADASVYALQVVDRLYLFRVYSESAAGLYSIALQLATVVFLLVRGFQYAWPPLAYSIKSDREASRLYSLVTTYYVLATGLMVCGVALLGRWLVRLLAAPGILRRLQGTAVAGARLGAVRPLPGADGAGRPRRQHDAQLPRGRRRPGGQRGAAAVAGARGRRQPRHRGCGPRPLRRLHRDARGPLHPHALALPRGLRLAPPRAAGGDLRVRRGLGRAAAPDQRLRRPRAAPAVVDARPRAADRDALLHRPRAARSA